MLVLLAFLLPIPGCSALSGTLISTAIAQSAYTFPQVCWGSGRTCGMWVSLAHKICSKALTYFLFPSLECLQLVTASYLLISDPQRRPVSSVSQKHPTPRPPWVYSFIYLLFTCPHAQICLSLSKHLSASRTVHPMALDSYESGPTQNQKLS